MNNDRKGRREFEQLVKENEGAPKKQAKEMDDRIQNQQSRVATLDEKNKRTVVRNFVKEFGQRRN